ncbi:MAG: putative toxin-antitoxin system toxin component, PIN family [bacterium]
MAAKKVLRAVFDANIYIAAALTKNPQSPTRELIKMLKKRKFQLVWCRQIREEVAEKLVEKSLSTARIAEFINAVDRWAQSIDIDSTDIIPVVIADPDDDVVVACAVKGNATHLVTYDPHFNLLGRTYRGIKIIDGLHFLYVVRGDKPKDKSSQKPSLTRLKREERRAKS